MALYLYIMINSTREPLLDPHPEQERFQFMTAATKIYFNGFFLHQEKLIKNNPVKRPTRLSYPLNPTQSYAKDNTT